MCWLGTEDRGLNCEHTEDIFQKVCYSSFANLGKMRPNPLPDNME